MIAHAKSHSAIDTERFAELMIEAPEDVGSRRSALHGRDQLDVLVEYLEYRMARAADPLAKISEWIDGCLRQAVNPSARSGRKAAGRGSWALAIWAKVIATPCSVDHTVRPVKHS